MNSRYLGYAILLILIFSFYYAWNYTGLFSSEHTYLGYYQEVNGLQESDAVSLDGVKIGYVDEIQVKGQKVEVLFAIEKDQQLPEGTEAIISRGDFTGTKSVHLRRGNGPGVMAPGSQFRTSVDSTILDEYHARVAPILQHSMFLLRSADTAMSQFNHLIINGWGIQTQREIIRFREVTDNFADAGFRANRKLDNIDDRIQNLQRSFSNPAETNRKINASLTDAEGETSRLKSGSLEESFNNIRNNFQNLAQSIKDAGESPILNQDSVYSNLKSSADSLSKSASELQKDPPGITIFGRKK